MNTFSTLLLLILSACTSLNHDKKVLVWERWKGLPISALDKHDYFKKLPVTKISHADGNETWLFRDQTKYQTGAFCQSMGGCTGIPFYSCDNNFSVKDGFILSLEQSGSCPGLKTIEPPPSL